MRFQIGAGRELEVHNEEKLPRASERRPTECGEDVGDCPLWATSIADGLEH